MLDPASVQCQIILPNLDRFIEVYIGEKVKKLNPALPNDKIFETAKKHLQHQIVAFENKYNIRDLQKCCPITAYPLSAYVYLSSQFREFISLGIIYKPQEKCLKNTYQTFIEDLMLFRYEPKQELKEKIIKNVKEIKAILDEIDQISESNKKRINQIILVFQKMLDYPDLFELPISLLLRKSSFKQNATYSASLLDTFKTYTNIFNEIATHLPTSIALVEERLKKYQDISFPKSEFLKGVLELLNRFKNDYLPKFITLQVTDFDKFSKDSEYRLNSFSLLWDRLVNNEGAGRIEIASIEKRNDYFGGDQKICFKNYSNEIEIYEKKCKEMSENDPEFLTNKIMLDFYKDFSFCHAILDGFISNNIIPLLMTTSVSTQVFLMQKNNHSRSLTKQQLKATQTPKPPPTDSRSVEELESYILGAGGQKKSKSKKREESRTQPLRPVQKSKPPSPEKSIESLKNSTQLHGKSKNTSSSTKKTRSYGYISENEKIYQESEKLSALLAQLCCETKPAFTKGCLRQAHMYLNDVIMTHKRLANFDLPDNAKRFYIMTFLQSAYYCLEVLLHHEKGKSDSAYTIKGNGHNLSKLLNQVNIQIVNKKIISDLFLTNYWTRAHLQQSSIWEKYSNIEILGDIKKIYETKNLSSLHHTFNKIQAYLPQINQLIGSLPSIKEKAAKPFSATPIPQEFKLNQDFSEILNLCQALSKTCENLLTRLPISLHPQFSQTLGHLQLIEGIFTELQEKSISPELFSLLVRYLIFWENTLLEDFLKVLYHLKTGFAGNGHSLTQLYKGINWVTKPRVPVDILFLNDDFGNIHNISRYPFTTLKTNASLYPLIIKSELLREHPELGEEQPFELAKKKNEGEKTPLNYIELHTEGLTPQLITQHLKETTHKIFNLINELMLPELRTSLG